MIKAVIFDVGGVLHTNEIPHVWDDIAKTLNISVEQYNSAKKGIIEDFNKGEITENKYWEKIKEKTHATGLLPEDSLYGREFKKRFTENKEILDLVKSLKKQGYKLAILTNTISSHFDHAKNVGLFNDFDVEVASHLVHLMKPNKNIYVYTLEKLGVSPDEAIFIDDTKENIDAANDLGIHGIVFTNKHDLENQLHQLGISL